MITIQMSLFISRRNFDDINIFILVFPQNSEQTDVVTGKKLFFIKFCGKTEKCIQ